MKMHTLTPSSILKDEEVGTVVSVDGKSYAFVGRDPWTAYLIRWYWFDRPIVRLMQWLRIGKKGCGCGNCDKKGTGEEGTFI